MPQPPRPSVIDSLEAAVNFRATPLPARPSCR
jgi:hypothetical protein